ncbi:MAG: efflux RND transporter periplasmic adaptor subunit [Sulfurimonas sp.]|uniref:efflux RND transporter periplasmic adaptor subunit n=1 Tax=Sulfurimonas sp. TaxID=2022749 RepID=UPI002626E24E|nr:efflux RND transporter periplasmic adaptor subunit [Sulfurimonas sp.]MDD3475528.1 efflux RND transporter periplasmic adaptor subunit [Sulfurimonas sp.]
MKILSLLTLVYMSLFATIEMSQKQQDDLGIKTTKVKKATNIEFGAYNAKVTLDAKDIISVGLAVDSVVVDIFVTKLTHVKKSQKLLSVKSSALLNLQKDYINALIESENSLKNYQRDEKLYLEGIISQKNLLASQKEKLNSALKVKLSEGELLMSGFDGSLLRSVRETHKLVESINILAPRDGLVDAIAINIGEKVESNRTMMKIYADAKRYLELNVPIDIANKIALGDRCYFENSSAKIVAISNIANEQTQSVALRAIIEDAKDVMINRVYFAKIKKSVENAFEIEKSALLYEQNKTIVFKKVSNGYEPLDVVILKENTQSYIIQAPLNENDSLASSSTSTLLSALEHADE